MLKVITDWDIKYPFHRTFVTIIYLIKLKVKDKNMSDYIKQFFSTGVHELIAVVGDTGGGKTSFASAVAQEELSKIILVIFWRSSM